MTEKLKYSKKKKKTVSKKKSFSAHWSQKMLSFTKKIRDASNANSEFKVRHFEPLASIIAIM